MSSVNWHFDSDLFTLEIENEYEDYWEAYSYAEHYLTDDELRRLRDDIDKYFAAREKK